MFEKLQTGEKIHDAPQQPRTCSYLYVYTHYAIRHWPKIWPVHGHICLASIFCALLAPNIASIIFGQLDLSRVTFHVVFAL